MRFSVALLWLLILSNTAVYADDSLFEKKIKPLTDNLCLGCHSANKHKGDLNLEKYTSLESFSQHSKIWEKVLEQISTSEMPPKKKKQFTAEEKELYTAWIRQKLDSIAIAKAGDPGPVVLRRLSNAEYTYTVRDLTGIKTLSPAKEFPVDGAAGEGFTNTGMSLVMSPALVTKFLDAGKDISSHAILVPDGIRWSNGTSRRDCTNELLSEIRSFYSAYTVPGDNQTVTLQGILLDSSLGRKLPHERYLQAAYKAGKGGNADAIAAEMKLSPVYLKKVITFLNSNSSGIPAGGLRDQWRHIDEKGIPALAAQLSKWQNVMWKFNKVGEVGFPKGPQSWMAGSSPLVNEQKINLKLPKLGGFEHFVTLLNNDNEDGRSAGVIRWREPRLILPDNQVILLKDSRAYFERIFNKRQELLAVTGKALSAAAEIQNGKDADLKQIAEKNKIDPELLKAWLQYLGIDSEAVSGLKYLTGKLENAGQYNFIKGWGVPETPSIVTNSSDQQVRIPGTARPHGVMMHPAPTLNICAGWRSPISGKVKVSGQVTHAHHDCGNGVVWFVQHRRGTFRRQIANGSARGPNVMKFSPQEYITVKEGDLISLIIGPGDGNHSCDLTDIEFKITAEGASEANWNLTKDVSGNILAGNPHADAAGTPDIWHFYTEEINSKEPAAVIPQGSLLSRWLSTENNDEKNKLAAEIQKLITGNPPAPGPDAGLFNQLTSLKGPLLKGINMKPDPYSQVDLKSTWGVDPALFGKNPIAGKADPGDLYFKAPLKLEIRLPAEVASESRIEADVTLISDSNSNSARVKAVSGKADLTKANWWNGDTLTPVLVKADGETRQKLEKVLSEIREVFPVSVCYSRIVPVDDVVTLKVFFREDNHLMRLALDDAQKTELQKLWHELRYVSREPLIQVDAFEQIWQYATQGGDPSHLEPMRKPLLDDANAFKQELLDTEPKHVEAVISFANQAYRRNLTEKEISGFKGLYKKLRAQNVLHEEAIHLLLTRVLISPGFLYKEELPPAGDKQAPVTNWELAARLSYFLWSSQPDDELRKVAADGSLSKPEVLKAQVKRMLQDPRTRRMATEFGCAWLHIHGFSEQGEKSEKTFPTFNEMKGEMYEEAILFFGDFFQNDRSVLSLLNADHTFINDKLAVHYGIPGIQGSHWRRLDGAGRFSRGGILGLGATLAQHSGASRTSPILRGNWVTEVVLGQKPPKPPKDVPQLPEDESVKNLTMREITEKHTKDPRCSKCHSRIDPFGFALENFDAIGRFRDKDHTGKAFNTATTVPDGTDLKGFEGLRNYLLTTKRDAFLKQFNRKLLGYALGRSVILSDKPLLDKMTADLEADNFKVSTVVEAIVLSRQFRDIRGRDTAFENVENED